MNEKKAVNPKKYGNGICPQHFPVTCNCFSLMNRYGTGYGPGQWPKTNTRVTNLFERFSHGCDATSSCSCYSDEKNYGKKFGLDYEKSWRCSTPTGCVRKRTEALEGVL